MSMAAAVLATGLVPATAHAQAAGSTLYVDNTASNCADGGPGTQEQPFCQVQSAAYVVQPGQTVRIKSTIPSYQSVLFTRSGTPEAPIRFTVDGDEPYMTFYIAGSGGTAVRFEPGLHDVQVNGLHAGGSNPISFAGTQSVTLDRSYADVPLDVADGSRVTIQRTFAERGIRVGKATDTILSTNRVRGQYTPAGVSSAIVLDGATGTAVTSNTIHASPGGVLVTGGSTGTRLTNNYFGPYSQDPSKPLVEVAATSTATTTASHSAFGTYNKPAVLYSWGGTSYGTIAAFQTATGQGAADLTENVSDSVPRASNNLPIELVDSADATAPGQLDTDIRGNKRLRFPSKAVADPSFHDRGAVERYAYLPWNTGNFGPVSSADRMTGQWGGVRVRAEWGAARVTATFHWGDGTTSKTHADLPPLAAGHNSQELAMPGAVHRYQVPGLYQTSVEFSIDGIPDPEYPFTNLMSQFSAPAADTTLPPSPYKADGSQLKADFDGDGRDDIALWEDLPNAFQVRLLKARQGGALTETKEAWTGGMQWYGRVRQITAGDFNGDGKAELGILFGQPSGHTAFYTLSYNAGTGRFDQPVLRWDAPYWGTGTRYVSAGDFNGDGKTDLALYYQYDASKVAVFTLNGNADGSLTGFTQQWEAPYWGSGTQQLAAGDFNGDGKSELALFYSYGGSHVAVFTLEPGTSGKLDKLTTRWNAPYWGAGTKFVQAGNFSADKKTDLVLFYDYGNSHVTAFSLTATDAGSTLNGLGTLWNNAQWGTGTRFVMAGNYSTPGGRSDFVMLYNYGNGLWNLMMLSPDSSYGVPWVNWAVAENEQIKTGV